LRISSSGDHTAGEAWPLGSSAEAPALASRVDAEVASPHPVLVAFGDSITEGRWTSDIHDDYPEQLAGLLAADSAAAQWVVINSGIGGNRLLQDGDGPSALARFGRDALDIPGVKAIVLLEGINDIGVAYVPSSDTGPVRAAAIIGAYRDLIRRAHARGLKIYLATLTPYMGASYERPAGEKVREEVNAWIRKGHGFDGVIDFDGALRDPAHPLSLIGADQLGDDLHPNDSGYGIMAGVKRDRTILLWLRPGFARLLAQPFNDRLDAGSVRQLSGIDQTVMGGALDPLLEGSDQPFALEQFFDQRQASHCDTLVR
jgi:lysophospholipase L1-like esterase